MTQELQQKIYDAFLQRFEAFRNSGYIINIKKGKYYSGNNEYRYKI
jgi:hypothetical protein